jgi:glycosyltransferase involved in cell wall biosynthesis
MIGKYPPIQGGVSMRTYWTAHGLAARGHDVQVVTNAKEVRPPFRMHMRAQDWERCEPKFDSGSVTVHWTDPVDRSQSYIPMASPFVSKLAALAASVYSTRPFDVIFSHYMEPYGIAGPLAAQMTGTPHVVRMAGSDAGRLWHHPQFEPLYDHVLRSASLLVATGTVADRARERGVDPGRIAFGGGYSLPQHLFTPQGPTLDFARLHAELDGDEEPGDSMWGGFAGDRPYFGVYGKLGERKGSFALLAALHRLKRAGVNVGLVALAHGNAEIERRFREAATDLGLTDRIRQIPFLPHWRVPEFLRGCLAVCCLEQDFPIGFHSPIILREVLLCGTCLVGSNEVIRKLPNWEMLPHGYGCIAIPDVGDIDALSGQLAAMARDPDPAGPVGARGRAFALSLERNVDFPEQLERVLAAAADPGRLKTFITAKPNDAVVSTDRFPITRLAAAATASTAAAGSRAGQHQTAELAHARRVLARVKRAVANGKSELRALAQGVQVEIAIAGAEHEADAARGPALPDPLFRLDAVRWAVTDDEIASLVPVRDPRLRIVRFDFDVANFRRVRTVADLPVIAEAGPSFVVVFGRAAGERREPLLIDAFTAHVLELCDGTRTVGTILTVRCRRKDPQFEDDLHWIGQLFVHGLIQLQSKLRGIVKAPATIWSKSQVRSLGI